MLFTDPLFLFLLLPLACLLFYSLTPKFGPSVGLGVLLGISLLFYLPWGLQNFALLILSITANFISAYFLLATPDSKTRLRHASLILGLLYNFASLFWFKYRLPTLSAAGLLSDANGNGNFSLLNIAIPIGISFYTFQQAIFLVDAYHRDPHVAAYMGDLGSPFGKLKGYIHHAFFVAFFPHLVIGPIIYLKEFQPQVESRVFGRLRTRDLEVGLTMIAIGLFKKVVLADNLAPIANSVFAEAGTFQPISATAAWMGALAYYAQLYFDFSGYSDMAIGTARLLGVRFPINFFSPLKAVGIMDFYKRWHITLTRVIARFLYTPLSISGARFALRRQWTKLPTRVIAQWIPLLINFEIIALWHGARETFVAFGVLHGSWYVLEAEIRGTRLWKSWKKRVPDRVRAVLGRILFTVPMILTFALFRSVSLDAFGHLVRQMFSGLPDASALTDGREAVMLLGAFAIIWFMPNVIELLRRYRPGIATYENQHYVLRSLMWAWKPSLRWACIVVGIFVAAMTYFGRQPPFLYMGF